MNRSIIGVIVICMASVLLVAWMLFAPTVSDDDHDMHGHDSAEEDEPLKGPHNGRLLQSGNISLEITVYETGLPPELRVYAYRDNELISPQQIKLTVKLKRLGNKVDTINFSAQEDYLRGDSVVYEPHSFAVMVNAGIEGQTYTWEYDNFEGRTEILTTMAKELDIAVESVGPALIKETRVLTGRVHINPNLLSRVRPRFPGVVKSIHHELGDVVRAGTLLAIIQSNESLQNYKVRAPIDGLIIKRDLQIGEATGSEPLFIIADHSSVWVELDIFLRDLPLLKLGQSVLVETLDGQYANTATINWISPLTSHSSQSVRARIHMPNKKGILRPGQFIRGRVTVAEHNVPLAVRQSAIQSFRDFKVVFARIGETYEVRMLELGRYNQEWVEVLGGIESGTEYVTKNSYIIKADIEKSGASHDH